MSTAYLLYGGGTFGSLDVISWDFIYIGVIGSSFIQRRRNILVTGFNVVGFYVHRCEGLIFCTEKAGHLDHWM